jgi:hypothetical protein
MSRAIDRFVLPGAPFGEAAMNPDAASSTKLRAPVAMRAGWRLLVVLPLVFFVLSIPARYQELAALARRASSQIGTGEGLLQRFLADPVYYALTALSLEVVFVLAFTLTSLAIVWRNQTDWRPLFFSGVFVFYSVWVTPT